MFLNGKSLGRKKKGQFEYRLRWDSVTWSPGELKVIAYRDGKRWTDKKISTTGEPSKIVLTADRKEITADGRDLAFIEVRITDDKGLIVPDAVNLIEFSIEGPGDIIATDNGDPGNMRSFSSTAREAFSGYTLAIVRSKPGGTGIIKVTARSEGLTGDDVKVKSK